MDLKFSEVPIGPDFSQLSKHERDTLLRCLEKLAPIVWDESILKTWYVNRKLTVLREPDCTKYFALTGSGEWRLMLSENESSLAWHVKHMLEPIEAKEEKRCK